MKAKGRLKNISVSYPSRNAVISLEVAADPADYEKYLDMDVSVEVSKFYNKRSDNANRMLWACIKDLCAYKGTKKWDEYLRLIKDYGQYTYVIVRPNSLETFRAQWRETEVIGPIMHNGEECIQVLCYFGSHLYNTKEFAALLDGVISEMKDAGLEVPATGDIKLALEEWEKEHGKRNDTERVDSEPS